MITSTLKLKVLAITNNRSHSLLRKKCAMDQKTTHPEKFIRIARGEQGRNIQILLQHSSITHLRISKFHNVDEIVYRTQCCRMN